MNSPIVDKNQSKEVQNDQSRDIALYFKEEGDTNFSPERNRDVIQKSIRKSLENRLRILKEEEDGINERVDAVSTYLFSLKGQNGTPVEKYFGKRNLAQLRALRIKETLQSKLMGQNRNIYIPG